jgi:hypothetical protein
MHRLSRTDRVSGVVVRYQREHPGEPVHLDLKKLGRIPDGGGHKIHGRATARFLVEAAGFFADHGVRVQRVLTDNAKAYAESMVFVEMAAGLGLRSNAERRRAFTR